MYRALSRLFWITSCLPLATYGLTVETAFSRAYTETEIRTLGQQVGLETGQGFRKVITSDPESTTGHYFILKLDDFRRNPAVRAEIEIIASDSKEARSFTWNLEGIALKKWLYLGLTGGDWPGTSGPEVRPLAWRIRFLDTNQGTVAEWKSFLWELP
jgi:hypothetical protein